MKIQNMRFVWNLIVWTLCFSWSDTTF